MENKFDKKGTVCERCRYSRYEILQVHHKNRDRNDNNIDNLELICPNCHYEEHLLEKRLNRNKNGLKTPYQNISL